MYSSVWNRVALLAAGMAFGWNLVNYWTAADADKRYQLGKVLFGAGGGLVVLIFLAFSSVPAAVVGLFIFGLSALVSYTSNAKHSSNVPPLLPLLQPDRPLERDSRLGVLIAHAGEPAIYDGPLPWAMRWAQRLEQGKPAPRWFGRPRIYARIRAAFKGMPAASSLHHTLVSLADALAAELGEGYRVQLGLLAAEPAAIATLTDWARSGLSRALILPLDLSTEDAERLRSEIARSRVREVGLAVKTLDPVSLNGQLPDTYGERFAMLCRGETPPAIALDPATWAHHLAERIAESG